MGNSSSITIAVLVDSFRYDMVGKETPFLLEMAERGITGILETPLSFSLDSTWFAGLYPETSNKFCRHIYSPKTSPKKRLSFINVLKRNKTTRLSSEIARRVLLNNPYGIAPNIPDNLIKYFDISEKYPSWHRKYLPNIPTIFTLLKKHKLNWLFIGNPNSDQRTSQIINKLQMNVKNNNYDFIWIHFAELDWACHKHGPNSQISKQKLTEIDSAIKKIYEILCRKYDTVNVLIFGDHGHVEISEHFDILKLLKQTSLKLCDDYVCFIDSTIARFWYNNERVGEEIHRILSNNKHGKILSTRDLIKLRCNFKDDTHGQLIWVVNEGCLILPNFWQGNLPVKGMHGYLPEILDNQTRYILSTPKHDYFNNKDASYNMVDIFPTMLKLLNISIPDSNEGISMM